MKKQFGFTLLSPGEFETWIKEQQIARTIFIIQEHHTLVPNYMHFNGKNHFDLQKGMQNFHVHKNGWQDIGQHFSIFPDGMIVTGRSMEMSPACIFGFNSNSVCIENVGNFDQGNDAMRPEQREAILRVTAALCKRFNVPINTSRIVYHHWFDLNTGARTDGAGVTKSCPGTNFFGGNKVTDADRDFLPLVQQTLAGHVPPPQVPVLYYAYSTAKSLIVRNKPSILGKRINATPFGAVLRVYEEKNRWCRISAGHQEWVAGNFLKKIARAVVNTNDLNVRFGPGTQFNPPVDVVNKGAEVFIYEERNNWVRIDLDERWVAKKFVTLT